MKPPKLYTPEDFQQFCDCQLWKDLPDRQHFADVCEAFNIASEAQAIFEKWWKENLIDGHDLLHEPTLKIYIEREK